MLLTESFEVVARLTSGLVSSLLSVLSETPEASARDASVLSSPAWTAGESSLNS